MLDLPGYEALSTLNQDQHELLIRARRCADHVRVLVLAAAEECPRSLAEVEYRHASTVLAHLANSRHVPQILALQHLATGPLLVMADRGGTLLQELLSEPIPLICAVRIGVALADALVDIHGHNVVHTRLTPKHILVAPDCCSVQVIGFGGSILPSPVPVRPSGDADSQAAEASEQRMSQNATSDVQSDLYAVGWILHRMLTGQPPVETHRAGDGDSLVPEPIPLQMQRSDIPHALSDLVVALLSDKPPGNRYQNATDLRRDLKRCLRHIEHSTRVAELAAATPRHPNTLQGPGKLYGRERETRALLGCFRHAVADGRCHLVLVSGPPGIGKTALVRGITHPVTLSGGRILSGKFDQYQRDVPYRVIIQAVQQFVNQILSESDATIDTWRQHITAAVGANGQVITDLVPELERIIGVQQPVPVLQPSETQNRFHMVFGDFLQEIARPEHPLVLFLDDMQWADNATLSLLQTIFDGSSIHHICVILAYRDSEVDVSHPFMHTVARLRTQGMNIERIALDPLDLDSLVALVADILRVQGDDPEVRELARFIGEKTCSNPFFVTQFLQRLYDDGLLRKHPHRDGLYCDPAQIVQRDYTDDVVEYMIARLRDLHPETQEVLKLASCIGNVFTLEELCTASGLSLTRGAANLWPAFESGLLVPFGDTDTAHGNDQIDRSSDTTAPHIPCRFQHDRVQQAAYSMLDEQQRIINHLRIGRSWRGRRNTTVAEEQLFAVANQLNQGRAGITAVAEARDLTEINLRAGRKAKASTAYTAAAGYLAHGAALLPEDAWDSDYSLAYAIHIELAECRYLCGAFDDAERLFKEVTSQARNAPEKAKVYLLRMQLYQVSGNYDGGVELAIEALALFDIAVPRDAAVLVQAIEAGDEAVRARLRDCRIEALADAPLVRDPAVQVIIALAVGAMPCAYIGRPQYFPWFSLLALKTSLTHGNAEGSSFAYSAYGCTLVSCFDDVRTAYELSLLGLALNERIGPPGLRGKLLHLHGNHFNYWCQPIDSNFAFVERAFAVCQEVGDLVFAGFIAFEIVWQFLERGDRLEQVVEQSQPYAAFARASKNEPIFETIRLQQQFVACLQGRTLSLTYLDDECFNEITCLRTLTQADFGCGVLFAHVMKQILHFHCGEYEASMAASRQAQKHLAAGSAMPMEATYYFYRALALCVLHARTSGPERTAYRRDIEVARKKWRIWARTCPGNFADRHLLLEAEVARMEGRDWQAIPLYEQAVQRARDQRFTHHEALGHELAGNFFLERALPTSASAHLHAARRCYKRWGAYGLAARLDRLHEVLLSTHTANTQSGPAITVSNMPAAMNAPAPFPGGSDPAIKLALTPTNPAPEIDWPFRAASEAMYPLDGSESLSGLAHRLLVAAKQYGAEFAYFIALDSEPTEVFDSDGGSRPLDSCPDLPRSIIGFVQRTGDSVLRADASNDETYRLDPHIARQGVRSLLCLPVQGWGRVTGLLYMETRSAMGTFSTETRIGLQPLLTQAAIALPFARHCRDLDNQRAQLNRDLRVVQTQLVAAVHQAGAGEIASTILHNVGNVLNNLNVSTYSLKDTLETNAASHLDKLVALLEEQRNDLFQFLSQDPRGRCVPEFLQEVAEHLRHNQKQSHAEVEVLAKHVQHLIAIVRVQRKYSGAAAQTAESCQPNSLVEDAIQLTLPALEQRGISVHCNFRAETMVVLDRHRILQILVNLIVNARYAMSELSADRPRNLHLDTEQDANHTIFRIRDTGRGIEPAVLAKLFTFGFTTRKGGHGFGLYHSAISARAMGGDIQVHSDGVGCGAVFTLRVPHS